MRILVLPSWYPDNKNPLNGVFFKEQVESLKSIGIDVIVLNINLKPITSLLKNTDENGITQSIEKGICVYRYRGINYFPKMYGLYIKYYQSKIKKYINKIEKEVGKIDLVHIHSAFDAGIAYGNMKANIPYVITEHSSRYHRNKINTTEDKMLHKAFENSKKVMAVGNGLKDKIKKYYQVGHIEVIPNLVSINTNVEEKKENDRFRFFSLAFLNTYKGMDILIDAFNLNRELFKNVELLIGGDGPERLTLEAMVNKFNLQKNIKFLGALNREEVSENMQNCDAFVLASRVETFGIVFLEAMTFGKPVVGTRTGGPDTFINDKCGLTVEIDNTKEFADAMKCIYINREQYNEEEIKRYIEDNFSSTVIAKKIVKIYKGVLGDKYD